MISLNHSENWFLFLKAHLLIPLYEARAALEKALTLLRDTGGRWHFWEIAGLLANLEEQAGNGETAAALRHEARTTLEFIIDHIPEGELRASFVGQPAVATIVTSGKLDQ